MNTAMVCESWIAQLVTLLNSVAVSGIFDRSNLIAAFSVFS